MSRVKSRQHPRRALVLSACLAILVLLAGYALGTQLAALPSTPATLQATASISRPAVKLAWPSFGAAAVGAVGRRGTLALSGSDASVPIASITKTVP